MNSIRIGKITLSTPDRIVIIILLVCMLFLSACANNVMIKQRFILNSIAENYLHKGFELLSVYEFNNFAREDWLYEFSGLAWDYDEHILYSITDGGYLVKLKPIFEKNQLVDIQISSYQKLKNDNGQELTGRSSDSEGMALINHNNHIIGDTELLISFERIPRVVRYKTDGSVIETMDIDIINHEPDYESTNKQFEAITEYPKYNFITGTERPFLHDSFGVIKLFNHTKQISQIHLSNAKYGALVGLTTTPKNNIIALERVFINVFLGLGFHLHLLEKHESGFKQTTVFSSTAGDGYFNDNFEGISHYKDNYFFMISDDNRNPYQRSLLVYFRLLDLEN